MASTFGTINAQIIVLSGTPSLGGHVVTKQFMEDAIAGAGGHAAVTVLNTAKSVILSLAGQQISGMVRLLDVFGAGQAQITADEDGKLHLPTGTTADKAAAGDHTHAGATTGTDGFLSAADKTKLNGIATGATALALAGSGSAGTAARSDHDHAGIYQPLDAALSTLSGKAFSGSGNVVLKSYADSLVVGLWNLIGAIANANTNPDYPAASKGNAYVVTTTAGKIGGSSGAAVDIGDVIVALADNAGGTQAAVGAGWFIVEHNLVGVLLAANNLSELTNPATARGALGLESVNNTSDIAKPVSTAQQAALDAKTPIARTISVAGLVTGGGNLSADRTITVTIASQAEAEAGIATGVAMTPLRTAQAIAALASGGGGATIGNAVSGATGHRALMANASGNLSQSLPLAGALENSSAVTVYSGNIGTGDIDLYTVPAGKRAMVNTALFYNSSGSSISSYQELKVSSTYYRVGTTVAIPTTVTSPSSHAMIYEPGDVIAVNTTGTGLNVWLTIILFDNTSGAKSPRLLSVINGDNTVYTVPSGKSAFGFSAALGTAAVAAPRLCNNTGSTVTANVFHVPSGQSVGTATKSQHNVSVGNGVNQNFSGAGLSAGDALVINSNTAGGQVMWVTIFEVTN